MLLLLSSPAAPAVLGGVPSTRRVRTMSAAAAASRGAAVSRLPPLLHRDVALQLAGALDERLGPRLLPSAVADDVRQFSNLAGTALGAVDVRRGVPGSTVDFMLESWLHCKVPNGSLDITSLLVFLNSATDAPNVIMEFIQGSPSSLVVILDLLPRRDLALHPAYVDRFYQNTKLDELRQGLESLPQSRPFRSQSLYVRSVLSPTAISVTIDCGEQGRDVLDGIVSEQLARAAREVIQIWIDNCATDENAAEMEDHERDNMIKRDGIVRRKSIEIDLSANLPRLFEPEVASRVTREIQNAFGVQSS